MTTEEFLAVLREAVKRNGGRVPGASRFFKDRKLTVDDMWVAGFSNYGEACTAAGHAPNTLTVRLSDDQLFRPLALLTRELGRYPAKGSFEVQRKRDPAFPSWEAYKRREAQSPESTLPVELAAWCATQDDLMDVAEILAGHTVPPRPKQPTTKQVVKGWVYLMRYGVGGQVYKVGISDNVPRRQAQLNTMSPHEVRKVHEIPTDDPAGIEKYWHTRFEERRVPGKPELFRLTTEDVAAFRSRKYQ